MMEEWGWNWVAEKRLLEGGTERTQEDAGGKMLEGCRRRDTEREMLEE